MSCGCEPIVGAGDAGPPTPVDSTGWVTLWDLDFRLMPNAGPLVAPFVVDQGDLVPPGGVTWVPHNLAAGAQLLILGTGLVVPAVAGVVTEWAPGLYTGAVSDALIAQALPDYHPAKYDLETWWQFPAASTVPPANFARFHCGLQNVFLRTGPLVPPNMGDIEISAGKLHNTPSLSFALPTGVFARHVRNGVDSFCTLPSVVGFTPTNAATVSFVRVTGSQLAEYGFVEHAAAGWPAVETCQPPNGLTTPSITAFSAPLAGATPTRCGLETDPANVGAFAASTNGGVALNYTFTLERSRVRYRLRYT